MKSSKSSRALLKYCFTVFTAIALLLTSAPIYAADSESLNELTDMFKLIEGSHISETPGEQLKDAAVEAMVKELNDPHTEYMTKEEYEAFNNSIEQHYVGIGVRLMQDDIGFYIGEVFKDSPALVADVRRGDYIVAVEGNPVEGKTIDDVVNAIVGEEGTSVNVTFERNGEQLTKAINRQTITVPVVTSHMFEGGIGYISLTSFSADADEKFETALNELKDNQVQSLIVDLRGNTGGLLITARNIAKLFYKEGVFIVTKHRQGGESTGFKDGSTVSFPVYLLVDQYSASASEILMGALQDHKVAKAIGVKTYGKGSVQQLYQFRSGSALKLTIEEYFTPNLRQVNNVGLEPDIKVEGEIPQMIAALRTAGANAVELALGKHSYTVNGYEVIGLPRWFNKDGAVYVPSRVLAAMVDAQITWNDSLKAVDIAKGDNRHTYVVPSEGILMEEGTTFINIDTFAKQYPQLEWKLNGEQIEMAVREGN